MSACVGKRPAGADESSPARNPFECVRQIRSEVARNRRWLRDGQASNLINCSMATGPEKTKAIWRFEPLADFNAPSTPTKETLRKKFVEALHRLQPSRRREAAEAHGDLRTAPAAVLERAAPTPLLDDFFLAVDDAIEAGPGPNGLIVLVLPPPGDFKLCGTGPSDAATKSRTSPPRTQFSPVHRKLFPPLTATRSWSFPGLSAGSAAITAALVWSGR